MDCEVVEYTNSTNATNVIIHNFFTSQSASKPERVFNDIDDTSQELVPVLNETHPMNLTMNRTSSNQQDFKFEISKNLNYLNVI